MDLKTGSLVSANDIKQLKARVKAECQRRSKTGNISNYGADAYDYTTAPTTGGTITKEHRDKIATPLNAIYSGKFVAEGSQEFITSEDMLGMEGFLTVLEQKSMTSTADAGCKGACAGACQSCTGTCEGSCEGSCTTSCTGGCTGGCQGCQGSCVGTCQGGCTDACKGCTADCRTECNWCDNTCYATCMDWCQQWTG